MTRKIGLEAMKDHPNLQHGDSPATNGDRRAQTDQDRISDLPPPLGGELPTAVYVSVLAAFGWVLLVTWLAFGGPGPLDLDLSVVTLIFGMLLGIPVVAFGVASRHSRRSRTSWDDFLSSTVDTASGPLPALQAWFGILIIPLALALAATLIGGAYAFVF